MDESKFIFCDTPTALIVRLDHLLHCPVWFEELKQDSNNSIYQTIELAEEHRTIQLKMFHAVQAIMSENWKQLPVHLIAAHLVATYPHSKLVIIDGYPIGMLKTAAEKIAEQIARVVPAYKASAVDVFWADGYSGYDIQLLNAQANAKEFNKVAFNLSEKTIAHFVPQIDPYNEALGRYHEVQKKKQADEAYNNPRFKPYIVKPGDDDGQGGMLQ